MCVGWKAIEAGCPDLNPVTKGTDQFCLHPVFQSQASIFHSTHWFATYSGQSRADSSVCKQTTAGPHPQVTIPPMINNQAYSS